ncbi:hypothetical protein CL684_01635 [Candidatus Campbellbacteria bacterium]|nr:hypothetical protein [Candidatus Campbellbacteria bacterium]|tara:strand:- start:336 stop:830 length:495 start_codon:yes stop_codon:yes gene_type:complete
MLHKKGFTLIELLVVISIIGVLSTIVLGSVGEARDNAKDARLKATLSQMRSQAELQALQDGNYNAICDATSQSGIMFRDAVDNGTSQSGQNTICTDEDGRETGESGDSSTLVSSGNAAGPGDNGNIWSASVQMSTTDWFCVDSSGAAVVTTSREIDGTSDKSCT